MRPQPLLPVPLSATPPTTFVYRPLLLASPHLPRPSDGFWVVGACGTDVGAKPLTPPIWVRAGLELRWCGLKGR